MYGLEGFWEAKEAPKIYIRAAYRTENKIAELFWESDENPGFSPGQSVEFSVEPDGVFRTYEIILSANPTYRGQIRRLRFDPVEAGVAGEVVDVESISAKKD